MVLPAYGESSTVVDVKFSVWPNPVQSTSDVLAIARWADTEGWYGVWFADHYMPNTPDGSPASGETLECWSVLPAIATATSRVRLGPLVAPTSVHHPALLAKRAATIDHLSNGRFVLGLGAGWQVNEHQAYGIALEEPRERVNRFEEAITIVRSLLDEDRTTFAGDVYTITDAPAEPKPVQAHLPLLVGTGSPRMLRLTARFADEWNTWGDPSLIAERRASFLQACEDVGRDPATMRVSVQALVQLTDDASAAAEAKAGPMGNRTIAGSAQQLVDVIGEWAALGVDEIIVPDFNLGATVAERLDALARIKSEVLDRFAS
jgi:probable F420-dependent oxidoreductase